MKTKRDAAGDAARLRTDRISGPVTDGICTHGVARLAEGFVLDDLIECPMHNGRFHIPTGRVDGPPACEALRTYPVRLDGEAVQIQLPE